MAMQFARAERAQAPDLAGAEAKQAEINQMRKNAQQLRNQGLMSGAAKTTDALGGTEAAKKWLAKKMAGDAAMTAAIPGGGISTAGMAGAPIAGGAVNASAAPTTAALLSGSTAAPAMSTAGATGAGAALGGGAAGGCMGAMSGLGGAAPALMSNPIGWGVLAALALGSMYAASK